MKPFFSIIIPTLNEEKFVGKLLNDLTHQTYRNFEVIVVDANSEDGTLNKVKQYQSKFSSLKIVKLQKRNVSEQRNKGALLAKGNYLVFLDADGRIKNHFIFRLNTYIKIHKGLLFLPKLGSIKNDQEMNLAIDFSNAFVAVSTKFGKPFSTGGSMVVERHFFSLIEGFNTEVYLSEDHLLVQTAHKYGVLAKLLPNVEVQFSMRRLYKEGKLSIFIKYIKSTIYYLAKGKVDKKIIEYEMGGHLYNKKSKQVFFDLMKINPQKLLKEFNKNMRAFVRGLDL